MGRPIPAMDVTPEDWDSMMDLNLRASFFCAQAAARHMLSSGRGRIINMSSQLSLVANVDEVIYCASKGALNQITKVLAVEWGAKGVIVTGVAPTFTYTLSISASGGHRYCPWGPPGGVASSVLGGH